MRAGCRWTKATFRISATNCRFVLTTEEVPEYNVLYVGQQQEDEVHCYVFDIAPKQIVGKKRYFQGRIWVDDKDFQIVKTYGQAVPETRDTKKKGNKTEHLYPKFTTWREQMMSNTGFLRIRAPMTRCTST